jgi:hypothetical protein
MKTLYHILTFIFLLSVVNSTRGQDLKSYKLKGKVKSYHEIDYEVVNKFGEIKKGNKVSDNSGVDELKSFDIKGKETECINNIVYHSEKGVTIIQVKIILKRDSQSNIFEKSTYQSQDNSLYIEKFKFNEIGQVLEETTCDSDGTTTSLIQYIYDENGNCTGYNKNGGIFSKEIFLNGYKTERIEFYPQGNINYSSKYDPNGNMIESSNYKPDGSLIFTNTSKYDSDGNKVEYISRTFRTITKYDLNGNKIENITYYNDGSKEIVTNKYTFDKQGNWVKRIQLTNDVPKYWTERTIVYYQ